MHDGKLKPGWTRVRFGDVVRLNTDRCVNPQVAGIERYVGLEHIDPEDLRLRRWGLVAEGTTFTNYFTPGQVLFGKRRAYQRKVAVADFEGVCSSDIYVFEARDARLLPELLPFICQTDAFFEHAVGTSAGSLSPRTNWEQLAKYEFTLPPVEAQKKVISILHKIEVFQDSNVILLRKIDTLIQSLINHYINITDESYKIVPVKDLILENPRNGISPITNSDGIGFRTVSIGAIRDGLFSPDENIKFAKVQKAAVNPYLVKEGDVFVVRGNGNRNLTGRCGLSKTSYEDLFYPDLLIRLRFNKEIVLPDFAVLQWNSPRVHNVLISRAKSTNGIWKINGTDITQHRLVVPPIEVQKKLLAEYEEIARKYQDINRRQSVTSKIKSIILNSTQ